MSARYQDYFRDLRVHFSSNRESESQQNRELRDKWPAPISQSLSSDGIPPDSTSGLDALNVLIRQIKSMHRGFCRDPRNANCKCKKALEHAEQRNSLLRYALSHFPDTTSGDQEALVSMTDVTRIFIKDLEQDMGCSIQSMTFENLVQSKLMYETFWSRETMLLTPGRLLAVPQQPDELWKSGPKIPSECLSPTNWDGQGDLGKVISSIFGYRQDEATQEQFLLAYNAPQIVFVKFTPAEGTNVKLADIRRIIVGGLDLEKDKGRGKGHVPTHCEDEYTLIAVLRCKNAKGQDLLRLYSVHGSYVVPPGAGYTFVDDSWEMGEPGHTYMLFYVRSYHPLAAGELGEVISADPAQYGNRQLLARLERQYGEKIGVEATEISQIQLSSEFSGSASQPERKRMQPYEGGRAYTKRSSTLRVSNPELLSSITVPENIPGPSTIATQRDALGHGFHQAAEQDVAQPPRVGASHTTTNTKSVPSAAPACTGNPRDMFGSTPSTNTPGVFDDIFGLASGPVGPIDALDTTNWTPSIPGLPTFGSSSRNTGNSKESSKSKAPRKD